MKEFSQSTDLNADFTATPSIAAVVGDIPGDTSTTEVIAVDGFREETLETPGDTDWFQIDLTAGEAIQIDLTGVDHNASNGLGALANPNLGIYDSNGVLIAENDNKGFFNKDSQLTFVAPEAGTYYISAGGHKDKFDGDYRLDVQSIPTPSPVTSVQGKNSLDNSHVQLVYFAVAGDAYDFGGTHYVASGTNAYEQQQMFSAFSGVSDFANLQFAITTDRAAADLEVGTAQLASGPGGTLLGFFNFPSANGDGSFGIFNNDPNSLPYWNDTPGGTIDTAGFMYGTLLHEFGHGMGLGHTHDTGNGTDKMLGVSNSSDYGTYGMNSAAYTVMSYNDGSLIAGAASSTADNGHAATYGALDIAALQNMYGANTTFASGDDVYTLFDANGTGTAAGYYSTWDTGGTDEISYAGARDATIDLRPATLLYGDGGGGFMSYVDGVIAGRTIAAGVTIENATSGSGNDNLTGNDVANVLNSGAGADVLSGLAGDDLLLTGGGNDVAHGDDGNDTIRGQDGGDHLFGDLGDDLITGNSGGDDLSGGAGNDTIWSGNGNDVSYGDAGDDVLGGGNGNDSIWGGDGNDVIYGTAGSNVLGGGAGNDTIWSGDSAVIYASYGNDEVHGNSGADTIWGGSGNDTITSGGGHDQIRGAAGNDILNGQWGNDTLSGGADSDTFVFSVGQDVVQDFAVAGASDQVDLSAVTSITDFADLSASHLSQSGADAVIDDLGGNTMTLLNVDINDLLASDFIF